MIISSHRFSTSNLKEIRPFKKIGAQMLLPKSSLNFVFMCSSIPHSDAIMGSIGAEQNRPIWNCGGSVKNYIARCDSSYLHPRQCLGTDCSGSEREAIASASYMKLRRALSLSYVNFAAPLIRKGKWSARMCSTSDGLLDSESAESSSLIGLNTLMASHPSLDEVSKSDIAGLDNPVENSISIQQIQIQSESHPTLHPLGSSLISMQGNEVEGDNVQVTSTNITEFVDSFVEPLHKIYPLVSGKNEDYKYSTLQLCPNGPSVLSSARGCRPAHVSESEYISGGSGIVRTGGNCEAADDQNSKSSTDMYYQSMLEANPGNPLLLSNYAKFLHEVQHDIAKAEEYYGRAILASPEDAEVLSLYAKFIWETHNDAARAEAYFVRAAKADPDDCYVLSSYAHFLWNSEEEEEDQNDGSADLQNVAAITCIGSVTAAA